jgi:NADH-quinone oxidoreductase subunit C
MGHSAPKIAVIDGIVDELKGLLGKSLIDVIEYADEIGLVVERGNLVEVMTALRDKAGYQQLMEIAGVDYLDRAERFEVVYMLLSVTRNHRIRVKLTTDENTPVPSLTALWPVAGWLEREVFDMYGVIFAGNTDLRRILTDYGFKGHPQRKDFPLSGFVELRYSEEDKRVVYEPVKLTQDFRSFDFMSPWEGAHYVLPGDEKAAAPVAPPPPPAPPPPAVAPAKAETPKAAPVKKPAVKKAAAPKGAAAPVATEKPRRAPVAKKAAVPKATKAAAPKKAPAAKKTEDKA